MKIEIYYFDVLSTKNHSLAGGKSRTLTKLDQAGLPVPDGFVILPSAFDGDELKSEIWEQIKEQLAIISRNRDASVTFVVPFIRIS